ncbi:right-handed parallel beta-helix repeat-containing protein [Sphingomonas radiodurans]|uniref:right-handed parallel beta-helix repeat-containing protein n=1 Tax=Sphingomonas radiodurans TaxID=2890321 RepID=UPI001E51161B|nr:right-handed parallel beta-helix repeat-containing protein [Sphingomonas radiodurans]WBH17246.1 right-handed parallel beta-helix repeat-containing protein [Sphingomonas radiodurans]
MRFSPVLLAALLAAPAASQQARAPFTVQETGEGYATLDDALMQNRGKDFTVLIAPGVYSECAVQQAGRVTFKAIEPGAAIFEGACEGKAALVLRGGGSVVDGLVFRNIRVPDGNGAGIRIEIGDLVVRNSMFLDSQEGILGGTEEAANVTIDRSTFSGLGQCHETEDCAHSVYLGSRGSVTITNSRFERGQGGHYVKLRVPKVTISDNSFDDTAGNRTNYMIDLPEGATGEIARNTFVQGTRKENWSGMIVVAAEQRKFRSAGLSVHDNVATLAPGQAKSPAFLANVSGERLVQGTNKLGAGVRAYETREP